MKKLALFTLVMASSSFAMAAGSINSMDHTCAGMQQIVQSQVKVHLVTPTNSFFVHSSPAGCMGSGDSPMDAYAPTKDSDSCKVGYACIPNYTGGGGNG